MNLGQTYSFNEPLLDALPITFPVTNVEDWRISFEKHNVFIETRQILHKDSESYGGIYIVPLRKGKFRAKVTLMCSEYLEEEDQYIDVEVV